MFAYFPCTNVLILNPRVGLTLLTSSPLIHLRIVVFPALSRPLCKFRSHKYHIISAYRKRIRISLSFSLFLRIIVRSPMLCCWRWVQRCHCYLYQHVIVISTSHPVIGAYDRTQTIDASKNQGKKREKEWRWLLVRTWVFCNLRLLIEWNQGEGWRNAFSECRCDGWRDPWRTNQ